MERGCRWLLVLLGLAVCLGCRGGQESNKYKDLDRPKPAEKGG